MKLARLDISSDESTRPIVVSAHTPDPTYSALAARLVRSLQQFGIEYVIYTYQPRGSWEANCAAKPEAILRAFYQHQRPVIWIDADAVVKGQLIGIAPEWADIGCYMPGPRDFPGVNSKLLSGTLYFAPTIKALRILAAWEAACKTDSAKWDQDHLLAVIEKAIHLDNPPRLAQLDPKFVCIHDYMRSVPNPVIVHYQASRLTHSGRTNVDLGPDLNP